MAVATGIPELRRANKAQAAHHLPHSWMTLYELTKLDDEAFARLVEEGVIHSDMQRGDIKKHHSKQALGEREAISIAIDIEAEEIENLAVKAGQWWRLGKHLLYCGDTSQEAFYSKLPKTLFAFADPPYNAKAAASHTNRGSVERMDSLASKRPDLAEKVRTGEMKSAEAMRQMKKDQVRDSVTALPSSKYRVLYADPPWRYEHVKTENRAFDLRVFADENSYGT